MTATTDAVATLDQDVWWRTREGLAVLIDDMTEEHRHNTAALILRRAADYAERRWRGEWFLALSRAPADLPDDAYSFEYEDRMIAEKLAAGDHVKLITESKLYQRLAA